jgi:release factor glutamine methyltransferase
MEEYSIQQVLERAEKVMRENYIRDAERDAQLLMLYHLKIEMAELITRLGEIMLADDLAQFSALIQRRLRREPLQYIMRKADFWDLSLYVDQRVLIPRPETEHIIEAILADYPEKTKSLSIVDVGTGSGCLSVALANEYKKAKVYSIDIDPGALEVATINASRGNVINRTTLLEGDLLEPLDSIESPRTFHIIVSNPPYISMDEARELEPEVIKSEPLKALVAGKTGLEVYTRLIAQLAGRLRKKGRFYLEVGAGQDGPVRRMVEDDGGLIYLRTVPDLQGIGRVVIGERRK